MRTIDGYLSRRAQQLYPDALVTHDEGPSDYRLEREGAEPVGLGDDFPSAQRALTALANATRARGGST